MATRRPKRKARAKKVHYIPKGYHAVTPYLACKGAARAIDFYRRAFGAKELMRMPAPGGKVGHAEIRIGNSRVMLADEYPDMDFLGPRARGGSPVHLNLYVPNVDAMVKRARAAGAKVLQPPQDKFYGDRSGSVQDPFGHVWHLATHKRDLSMAALRKGAEKAMKEAQG